MAKDQYINYTRVKWKYGRRGVARRSWSCIWNCCTTCVQSVFVTSEGPVQSVFRLVQSGSVCHGSTKRFPLFVRHLFYFSSRPCVRKCVKGRRYRHRRNLHRDIEYPLRNSLRCNATSLQESISRVLNCEPWKQLHMLHNYITNIIIL